MAPPQTNGWLWRQPRQTGRSRSLTRKEESHETTKIEMTKIEASEGMTLYNGETMGKVIFLGSGDSVENWWEITEEQYKKILEDQERKIMA